MHKNAPRTSRSTSGSVKQKGVIAKQAVSTQAYFGLTRIRMHAWTRLPRRTYRAVSDDISTVVICRKTLTRLVFGALFLFAWWDRWDIILLFCSGCVNIYKVFENTQYQSCRYLLEQTCIYTHNCNFLIFVVFWQNQVRDLLIVAMTISGKKRQVRVWT